MSIFLFIFFILFLIIGTPIAVVLGIACVLAVLVTGSFPVAVIVQKTFNSANSFTLMAIPFFILAGNIMSDGGVSKRLVDLAASMLGRLKGGLALVSTVACTFFGAISGSAPATTAAIGAVMIKPMKEKGYDANFAGAVVAASGTIGLIIPPSITMVLYGVSTGTSIAKLFLGGIIPGIFICIALMTLEYVISSKKKYQGSSPATISDISKAFKNSFLALLMPVIILGGIYAGIFTPTEAAVVAIIYGLLIGVFVYKELKFKDISNIILKSAKSTATLMYLIVTSEILSYVLVSEQIPQQIVKGVLSLSSSTIIIQLIMMLILLVVGTFLNNSAAMLLLAPIFFPIISSLGIDPVFFGILMVVALAIGHVTPPVGLCLFIACDIGGLKIENITKAMMPFLVVLILCLLVLNFTPAITLFLPSMMK